MRSVHPKKNIKLTQIVNIEQARKRILFKSKDEINNPEVWQKIIRGTAGFSQCGMVVIDNTPEQIEDGLKEYSILYGLKYLYAAEQLKYESVWAAVIDKPEELDMYIVTDFFNADYYSLSEYEKGLFLERLMKERNLSVSALARKSGCSFHTLSSLCAANTAAKQFSELGKAYEKGNLCASMVIHSKVFFDMTAFSNHGLLTDYLIRYRRYAVPQLRETIECRDKNTTARQAILYEISRPDISTCQKHNNETSNEMIEVLHPILNELSGEITFHLCADIINSKSIPSQIKEILNLRQKCLESHKNLYMAVPRQFALDFRTALTLPDRAKSSYAVPAGLKKKIKREWSKKELRLFCRMLEYLEKSNNYFSQDVLIEQAYHLFLDFRCQNFFSSFFRYSILYKNKRDKLLTSFNG